MSDTGVRKYGMRNLPRTVSGNGIIQSQDVDDYALNVRKMNYRHLYIHPTQQPLAMLKGATGAAAAGTTGAVNLLSFPGQGVLEQHIKGAGQTLIVPTIAADGLEISGDQTDDEGIELCAGLFSRCPGCFVVGTDPAFYMRARYVIDDVSGSDDFAFGFRKNGAYAANIDDYTDMAVLNLISGQLTSETILNNAATVSTSLGASFLFADLAVIEVKVLVSASGAVTYQAGVPSALSVPSLAPAFTFDTGDTVSPFMFFLHSADLAGSVRLRQFEAGFQEGSR